MSDREFSRADKISIIAIAALLWVFGPFAFWLLGSGFAGEVVFWPDFGGDAGEVLMTLLWLLLFYGPLLLFLTWLARKVWRGLHLLQGNSTNAQD